jgi:hypothetical protein
MPRDLGGGLILRSGRPEDIEALVEFNTRVHVHPWAPVLDQGVAFWTRDLASGGHPTTSAEDFFIVEDATTASIVSSLCLISGTYSYGGVCFPGGVIELVGTDPAYRGRGLIRAQFEAVHASSAGRGQPLQLIGGIPNFYRQFGYEMAIELGYERHGYKQNLPALKEGQAEPYRLRPATPADLGFIAELDGLAAGRYLLYCCLDQALWRYELDGRSQGSAEHQDLWVIELAGQGQAGQLAGFATTRWTVDGAAMGIRRYELAAGQSWAAVTPSLLRQLKSLGEQRYGNAFRRLAFWTERDHPAYASAAEFLRETVQPYAYYARVPDLPAFLRLVAPVLEARLAASDMAHYTGGLKLTFYRGGLHLAFEQGKLAKAEAWQPAVGDDGHAGFPELTFLKLLFGYRDVEELLYAFPDCWVGGGEPRALLEALFPKQSSLIEPVV